MRVVIMGAGGIGGFFGAMMARAGEEVWFIGRGEHANAMQRQGLRVKSTSGNFTIPPAQIAQDPASARHADLVLFCVKTYDTEVAARRLSPIVDKQTLLIPLQNGVESVEKIKAVLPDATVYGGVAYISSRITAPGEITETGGFQRIVFGPIDGVSHAIAGAVHESFQRAGIKSTVSATIAVDLWQKLMFIASMGSLTAASRLTQGEIIGNPASRSVMLDAMREAHAVAHALGIDVNPVDEHKVIEGIKRFSPDTRSSMYFDLVNKKPLEVDSLNGAIIRYGQASGVSTPVHRTLFGILLPYHLMHRSSQSSPSEQA